MKHRKGKTGVNNDFPKKSLVLRIRRFRLKIGVMLSHWAIEKKWRLDPSKTLISGNYHHLYADAEPDIPCQKTKYQPSTDTLRILRLRFYLWISPLFWRYHLNFAASKIFWMLDISIFIKERKPISFKSSYQ